MAMMRIHASLVPSARTGRYGTAIGLVIVLLSACNAAVAAEQVVDVNMRSLYVRLPLFLTIKRPAARPVLAPETQIQQVAGPEAELYGAYPIADKGWEVWARLPDQPGVYVFAKREEKITVTVEDETTPPFERRITVRSVGDAANAAAAPMTVQRAILLPITGPVTQVSGPKATLLSAPESDERAWVAIPDQVCTLVFEDRAKKDRAVLRVWEDKDHRVFVSNRTGDDANPGTEERPFKTIHHAMSSLLEKAGELDHRSTHVEGDIYVAGGDYVFDKPLTMTYQVSLYGGFDENGWRRDPIVTESVLLPHGFRENWPNDVTDRYKDLRRAEPRYRETTLRLLRGTAEAPYGDTLNIGTLGGPSMRVCGSPDTYIDGVTIYGADSTVGAGETSVAQNRGPTTRTIRNCQSIFFWGHSHTCVWNPNGWGRFENNLIQGGIVGTKGHTRPQIVGAFGHWDGNLIMFSTGGDYSRILNLWGEAGTFTGNQIHGGASFGLSGIQAHHGGMNAQRIHTFRGNTLYMDLLFHRFLGSGLIMEDNDITLLKRGVRGQLWAAKALTIRNNTFRLGPDVSEQKLFPTGDAMTKRLGGKFVNEKYIEPKGEGAGVPVIENNRFIGLDKADRRNWNLVDVEELRERIAAAGEEACIRPTDPARNLEAEVVGATVRLSWESSRDPSVVGYIVRYGPQPNSYLNPIFVEGATTAEIADFEPGRYYFTVAACKEANVECWKLSNEVAADIK